MLSTCIKLFFYSVLFIKKKVVLYVQKNWELLAFSRLHRGTSNGHPCAFAVRPPPPPKQYKSHRDALCQQTHLCMC